MNTKVAYLAKKLIEEWGFVPSLRISVTDQCNLHCYFCHNEGNQRGVVQDLLSIEKYKEIADTFRHLGVHRVKLTGGEPTLRVDLEDIVRVFKVSGYDEVSLISNGVLLTPERQRKLRQFGVDRVNVSLNSLDPLVYSIISRTNKENMLKTTTNLKNISEIFPNGVKINTVFIPGLNFPMEVISLAEFSRSIGATLSVLSLLEEQGTLLSEQVVSFLEAEFKIDSIFTHTERIAETTTIHYTNGIVVEIDDFRQKKALYAKNGNNYCKQCPVRGRCTEGPYAFRIKADGTFKPCLLRQDNEIRFWD